MHLGQYFIGVFSLTDRENLWADCGTISVWPATKYKPGLKPVQTGSSPSAPTRRPCGG
jgi:hypothetical protein